MKNPFRTERLILRAIEDTPEDDAFVHLVQADPVSYALSNLSLPRPETMKASKEWKTHLTEKCLLAVIICIAPSPSGSQETPVPIGIVSLTAPRPGLEHHRNSSISIDIVAEHQGKGYGGEAINWILNWGFQMAGLHRIGIDCFSYNAAALHLYERLSFVLEGRRRESIWFDGSWHDWIEFGMLEGDWKDKQRRAGGTA
ncbi:GNAT family acetyltransferase [Macrophomina phaseolina]|uniref:GNAT family acetyltransferase n=1 Tax=Macrophomina phaseolina TaxID=35725 RepID=A0ABQ8GUG6_9PEZI|nr:GNAT family acetyltransferase [Macrophomina phaseolina]